MTPQQVIRAAALLEDHAVDLLRWYSVAGRWDGAYGSDAHREHDECRRLAGALRAMAARYLAAERPMRRGGPNTCRRSER